MEGCGCQRMELLEKHEEILGKRAELLEQMERRREQLNILRRLQVKEREAGYHRNAMLLQDLQQTKDQLRRRQLPHPHLLALETRYWVCVEESIPVWEHFFLGKGPHPTEGQGQIPRKAKENPSIVNDKGLPPRPKPRGARWVRGQSYGTTKA